MNERGLTADYQLFTLFDKAMKFIKTFMAGDWIALLFSLFFVLVFSVGSYSVRNDRTVLEIRNGETTWMYTMDRDLEIKPLDDDGTCLIELKDKKARVLSSDCPNKICISMGEIGRVNDWIACLPHQLFLRIIGDVDPDNDFDAASY